MAVRLGIVAASLRGSPLRTRTGIFLISTPQNLAAGAGRVFDSIRNIISHRLMPSTATTFDEDGEWPVRQFVAPGDLKRSPEEYVARHLLGSFSFHLFRYADPELAKWAGCVGELLASEGAVKRCRAVYFTADEAQSVRALEAEAF